MAHIGANTIDYLILGVAGVSLLLTALALGAYRRAGDRRLLFVAAAFFVSFLKGAFTVYALVKETPAHEDLELYASALDLVILLLFMAPFAASIRRPRT